jgi:hypothetical protein
VVPGVRAAVVHVPADHASIQAALIAAAPGDTVLVAPGRYRELIRMECGVTLKSSHGPDSTVLVCPGLAEKVVDERLMEVPEGCDRSTVIEGFTFDPDRISGCAIYVAGAEDGEKASPTIRGNVFLPPWGWAIYLRYSDALIEDNLIDGANTFAILCRASSPEIYRNEIRNCVPQAINVAGKSSNPVIGGSPANANKLYGNLYSVVNESRNEVDATHNDWGWETAIEMDDEGYPSDIVAILDGHEESKEATGRGIVDYRHWVSPRSLAKEEAGGGGAVPWAIVAAAAMIAVLVLVSRRRASSA